MMQNSPIPLESGKFSYFPQLPPQLLQLPPLGQPMQALPFFLER